MSDFIKPTEQIASCGDVSCEFLVNPIPRPKPPAIEVNTTPENREVVFLDNHKPNSLIILRGAQRILRERGVPVREEITVKLNASLPAPASELDELAATGGLILCGIGDCGSCSSGSTHDAILLQQRGAAAIAIVTEPFATQMSRVAAYYETDRPIPVIVLDHPMQNLSPEALYARSQAVADAAQELLTSAQTVAAGHELRVV